MSQNLASCFVACGGCADCTKLGVTGRRGHLYMKDGRRVAPSMSATRAQAELYHAIVSGEIDSAARDRILGEIAGVDLGAATQVDALLAEYLRDCQNPTEDGFLRFCSEREPAVVPYPPTSGGRRRLHELRAEGQYSVPQWRYLEGLDD